MTRPEYVENIKSKGLLLSEKIKIYKQQPYIRADQLVDAYTGPSRRGKEWMTREAAHYFIFEGDKAEAFKNNDVKCYFSVDSKALDRKRLFVSSVKVYEALCHYCAEERIKIKEICNCFVCTGGMIYSHLIFISKTGR